MKKVLSIIAIAAVSATFVACGPSQAELDAAAKNTADSLENVRIQDSTNAAIETQRVNDSIAQADAAKKIADSLEARKQDSLKDPKAFNKKNAKKEGK